MYKINTGNCIKFRIKMPRKHTANVLERRTTRKMLSYDLILWNLTKTSLGERSEKNVLPQKALAKKVCWLVFLFGWLGFLGGS